MKATGSVRRIDQLGRIVLPIELRKNFNIDIKDSLEIYVNDKYILLKKYMPACIFCGSADNLMEYKSKKFCKSCQKSMIEQV